MKLYVLAGCCCVVACSGSDDFSSLNNACGGCGGEGGSTWSAVTSSSSSAANSSSSGQGDTVSSSSSSSTGAAGATGAGAGGGDGGRGTGGDATGGTSNSSSNSSSMASSSSTGSGGTTFGPVHTFQNLSSGFYVTAFGCSNTGTPAGDALWFCQHFYAIDCIAEPGWNSNTVSVASTRMHSGTNCYNPDPTGMAVPNTSCVGGPCKIGNYTDSASGLENIVCACP